MQPITTPFRLECLSIITYISCACVSIRSPMIFIVWYLAMWISKFDGPMMYASPLVLVFSNWNNFLPYVTIVDMMFMIIIASVLGIESTYSQDQYDIVHLGCQTFLVVVCLYYITLIYTLKPIVSYVFNCWRDTNMIDLMFLGLGYSMLSSGCILLRWI